MRGDGFITDLINKLPSSDSTARPKYPGEKHAILKLPNHMPGIANYMGPGTHVIDRLKRGDPGRTPSDTVAKRHDIDFTLAQTAPNKKIQLKLAREADKHMVKSLKKIQKGAHGGDSFANIQAGMKGIEAKMALENRGFLDPSRFSGPLKKYSINDTDLLIKNRDELKQEGYGLPGAGLKKQILGKLKRERLKRVSSIVKMSGRGLTLPGGQLIPTGDLFKYIVKDVIPSLTDKLKLPKLPMKTIGPLIGTALKMSKGKDLKGIAKNLATSILPMISLLKINSLGLAGSGLTGRGRNLDSLTGMLALAKRKLNDKLVTAMTKAIKMYASQLGRGRTSQKFLAENKKGNGLKLSGQGLCGGSFWSSFAKGFKSVFKPGAQLLGTVATAAGQPEFGIPLTLAGKLV
jgi:hypothetical protein